MIQPKITDLLQANNLTFEKDAIWIAAQMPKSTAELQGIIGLKKTVLLTEQFGGAEIRLPRARHRFHEAVFNLVGWEDYKKLHQIYAGDRLRLPQLEKLRKILRAKLACKLLEQGSTVEHTAYSLNTSERQIYRWRAAARRAQQRASDEN
jgi:hypothetical protein